MLMLQINIMFMQNEEKNSGVECTEDNAIRAVPSGQSSIIIDPSQSLQVLSVPGSEKHILVHFIPDNTNITMDQTVSFIFVIILNFCIPLISKFCVGLFSNISS